MSLATTQSKVVYTGNGSASVFSVPFKFLADGDLTVTKVTIADGTEDVLTLTTDYTLTGAAAASGGELTLVAGALASTFKLVIRRTIGLTQDADYIANDPFAAETHELVLDRLVMMVQQLQEQVSRSLKLPITEDEATTIDTDADTQSLVQLSAQARVGVRVYNSAAQALTTGVAATLTFDSERWDTNAQHSVVTNTSRLTCAVAGPHHLFASVAFTASATGIRRIHLLKNGAVILARVNQAGQSTEINVLALNTVEELVVGDYIEVIAYANTTGISVQASDNVNNKYSCEFGMELVA